MGIRLERFSYRFAEQVLNSKLALKQEIEQVLTDAGIDLTTLSRPKFNDVLRALFAAKGWQSQHLVLGYYLNTPTDIASF